MQFVGYCVYETAHGDHGIPLAAGADHDAVFSNTFRRLVELYGGKLMHCHDSIAVRERDITPEDAASIERIIEQKFAEIAANSTAKEQA